MIFLTILPPGGGGKGLGSERRTTRGEWDEEYSYIGTWVDGSTHEHAQRFVKREVFQREGTGLLGACPRETPMLRAHRKSEQERFWNDLGKKTQGKGEKSQWERDRFKDDSTRDSGNIKGAGLQKRNDGGEKRGTAEILLSSGGSGILSQTYFKKEKFKEKGWKTMTPAIKGDTHDG